MVCPMNLVVDLLLKYYHEEKGQIFVLISISLLVNLIQATGISYVTSRIIQSIETRNRPFAYQYYGWLIVLFLIFIALHNIYKSFQNKLLTKLRQWMRYQILRLLLLTNNDDLSETNFTKISSPINRISSVCFMLFNDIISNILPTLTFLAILSIYFLYHNWMLGLVFLLGNTILFYYIYSQRNNMMNKNAEYESYTVENESYLLEILNNIDKIIYRGQVHREIETFWDKTSQAIDKAMEFYSHLEIYGIAMHLIVIGTIIVLCGMLIQFYFAKKIGIIFFITFLTMILLYREKMLNFVQMVPDFVEFVGRTRSVLKHFKEIHRRAGAIQETPTPAADNPSLEFREIRFEKVSFKYKTGDYLFRQTDLTLKTDQHRIIGITGLSGRGKSTFIKLILKMYRCEEGRIYIDGVDIGDLDANYIRANVTYVSQSAKLFDTKVVDNMMYGCIQDDACKAELERIMQYPKIRELYKNVDIYQAQAGALGENLSGGQRQVANIIGGLINPSKILILDEPTNALDAQLKQEVLALIGQYKDRKQAMVIITHDRDVYPLFSENIVL